MPQTLLQLAQAIANEIGIAAPVQVVNNAAQDIIQLYALINACGSELIRKHNWSALAKPYLFLTGFVTTIGNYNTASNQITGIPSTAGLDTSYLIVGAGFPNTTFVQSVDSPSQVTATQYPNQSAIGGTVYFQKVKYDLPSDYDS